MPNNDTYTTEDMTLVTILKMRGMEPLRLEKANGGCKWIFTCSDSLDAVVEEYTMDEAYVEPREYTRKLGLVRTEMYKFLGHSPRRVRPS